MKLEIMNGWRDAPHCWRNYWKVKFSREYYGYELTVFGIVFMFVR